MGWVMMALRTHAAQDSSAQFRVRPAVQCARMGQYHFHQLQRLALLVAALGKDCLEGSVGAVHWELIPLVATSATALPCPPVSHSLSHVSWLCPQRCIGYLHFYAHVVPLASVGFYGQTTGTITTSTLSACAFATSPGAANCVSLFHLRPEREWVELRHILFTNLSTS